MTWVSRNKPNDKVDEPAEVQIKNVQPDVISGQGMDELKKKVIDQKHEIQAQELQHQKEEQERQQEKEMERRRQRSRARRSKYGLRVLYV